MRVHNAKLKFKALIILLLAIAFVILALQGVYGDTRILLLIKTADLLLAAEYFIIFCLFKLLCRNICNSLAQPVIAA